jgi:hypothetical protein
VFGQIVPWHGYPVAWLFLGVVTAATALIGLVGRNSTRQPATEPAGTRELTPDEVPVVMSSTVTRNSTG